ncbi:MAG: hypothetical protein PHC41_06830 [Lachnospiraceae bacterium]|nr:hypothetical protein [Lachnospiraceae bacterium]MDD3615927.1 hypothetical protein [Lachnospiraceae bacterium]
MKKEKKYPIKFRIVEILGMIVPLFPVFIWGGVIVARDCNSYWMFLGMVGAFLIGNGLFNIIAISVEQYLGHLVTLLTLVIGTLMVICSLMLI